MVVFLVTETLLPSTIFVVWLTLVETPPPKPPPMKSEPNELVLKPWKKGSLLNPNPPGNIPANGSLLLSSALPFCWPDREPRSPPNRPRVEKKLKSSSLSNPKFEKNSSNNLFALSNVKSSLSKPPNPPNPVVNLTLGPKPAA
eukprot:TRINITY_DN22207_c0_g1_i2.p1 TRINITY_DN22207_c0_g1~~TRINITY_DN22207_c0_g1_i2.p1  ORF type:complete len:143 (+),score=29.26 TRINITY_DN22207_c0_g1_i2:349-777(+)